MEKEQLLKLLAKKDQSVEKVKEQSPYSQDDLSKFISGVGFDVEQTPKLSEIARLLNKQSPVLDEKKELEGKVEKNPLSIVRANLMAQNNKDTGDDKQLSIQALKKLIAKYKDEQ
jgi:hypothetical protein